MFIFAINDNGTPLGTVISGAILSILPSTNKISQSSKIPFGPHVQSVASLIKIAFGVNKSSDTP